MGNCSFKYYVFYSYKYYVFYSYEPGWPELYSSSKRLSSPHDLSGDLVLMFRDSTNKI